MKMAAKLVMLLCILILGVTGSVLNTDVFASDFIAVEGEGVALPESVIHDAEADLYLVSNFGAFPPDPANPGFISRLRPDGTVEDPRWIDGLLQPKGLAIDGDLLYVSDVFAIRVYDRATGALLDIWPVPFFDPTANWLNGVTVGPDGTVYATDSGFSFCMPGVLVPCPNEAMAVYKSDGHGNLMAITEDPSPLAGPNGIIAAGSNVFVAAFFSNIVYRTNPSGKLFPVAEVPGFFLDGLVRMAGNSLLVSSWMPPAIHMISPSRKNVTTILDQSFDYFQIDISGNPLFNWAPAGIGFDHARNRILIPVLMRNAVIIYPME